MKFIFLYIFFFFCINTSNSQHYHVESFQDEYEEIEDYNSLMIELEGDLFWYHQFELDFIFPFFDLNYPYINGNYRGLFGFDDEIGFSMDLMSFGYQPDNVWDTINILSDVRYKYLIKDGIKGLVIQYTKNRLISDPSIEEHDSHVNFQYLFFEDGTIEFRFGPSNLSNSPVYVPGEGFYLLTNQGPIPFGPSLGLTHPLDTQNVIIYNDLDSLQNFEIVDKWSKGSINWWPPDGWVIRFTNLLVSAKEEKQEKLTLYPNPVSDKIYLSIDENIKRIEVSDMNGRVRFTRDGDNIREIDVSTLPPGAYFVRLGNDNNIFYKKIIKI